MDNLLAFPCVLRDMRQSRRHHESVVTEVKHGAGVAMFAVLLGATSVLGYGVAAATGQFDSHASAAAPPTTPPIVTESALPTEPTFPKPTRPAASPTQTPTATQTPTPATPPKALLEPGDQGSEVRVLQARLRQIQWYAGEVTDTYGEKTAAAVKGFQAKRGLPVLGYVDAATMERLEAMTRPPSADELANKVSDGSFTHARLDDRCRVGRALCIDKTSRTIRWVVDGKVRATMAVRFGGEYTPTREGIFSVNSKSRDHVSSLYDTPMPFAMFFSRGQAVHFSPDFAARGYSGASHGCVNVRDYDGIKALFDQVQVGDKVVVYWS